MLFVWRNRALEEEFWFSGRRKKTEGQAETEMGRWCDGRCEEVGGEIGGMLQGIGTAGRSF